VAALLLAGGCSVPDSARQANHQNRGAGALIAEKSTDPEIKQAGTDVALNAEAVESHIGAPQEPKPYSPAVSAAARDQAKKDAETPWWKLALGSIGTFLLGLLTNRTLTTLLPSVFGGPAGTAAVALAEGIARVRDAIKSRPAGEQAITEKDLLELLVQAQKDPAVRDYITSLAHKAEAKLNLQL